MELRFYQKYGKPFVYRRSTERIYRDIPYGESYEYLLLPNLQNDHWRVLILMLSSTPERDIRERIRKYTSRIANQYSSRILFVMGSDSKVNQQVYQEGRKYGDIIQTNHINCYHNLSLPVFAAFQFISRYSNVSDYVLKTDSDCVLNLPLLLQQLSKTNVQSQPYGGFCRSHEHLITKKGNKHYVPLSIHRHETEIPTFSSGGGYYLANWIIPQMLIASRHLPFITHSEDVNVARSLKLLNATCTSIANWISLSRCVGTRCLEYAIVHKKMKASEFVAYHQRIYK